MIGVLCTFEEMERILRLARQLAEYNHDHKPAGYPYFEEPHTGFQAACRHPDCCAVRAEAIRTQS